MMDVGQNKGVENETGKGVGGMGRSEVVGVAWAVCTRNACTKPGPETSKVTGTGRWSSRSAWNVLCCGTAAATD
jgi:hypothetical protein